MDTLTVPDTLPYLLAILGLLLLWQLHEIQVRAGRIKAVDILRRDGVRLLIHLTPDDGAACDACRAASGTAFLPVLFARKPFTPIEGRCANPAGCRCVTIGLAGTWPEAERLVAQLRLTQGRLRLSAEQLDRLLEGTQARRSGTVADQVSLCVLGALRAEGRDPQLAITQYRFAIEHAQQDRDRPLALACYPRLADLLERTGRYQEALGLVDRFLRTHAQGSRKAPAPTEAQLALMSLRKTRLMTALRQSQPPPARPA
ncbi:hypothetical protein [Nitrospira sp. Kam-Ns4a]